MFWFMPRKIHKLLNTKYDIPFFLLKTIHGKSDEDSEEEINIYL